MLKHIDPCARYRIWILLLNWIWLFLAMTSKLTCCVPNCNTTQQDGITLHVFPNPDKEPDRFQSWRNAIGGDILALDNQYIYKQRRVCHKHFETKYCTWRGRIVGTAVPRLHLTVIGTKRTLQDTQNERPPQPCTSSTDEPSPAPPCASNQQDIWMSEKMPELNKADMNKRPIKKQQMSTQQSLKKEIKKLHRQNDSFKDRLKKAKHLSTNTAFLNALKKFKTLAAIFTVMQFREIGKPKMGRRFKKEEKVMALSLYKLGPRAYRWLSQIFVLPSPVTLSRLISRANLKPGLNENIFLQLQKKAQKMKTEEKLCTLIFDEMALSPNFEYNRKKDKITGFVNHTGTATRNIGDHVLVFMIRGILKNYKQPIYYSFCRGSTPKQVLAVQIQDLIKKLHSIGFKVLATVCDQGATNSSAINYLVDKTRETYLRSNKEFKKIVFEVEGEEIIPLFDVPHLLKGLRNNLLTKNLKFYMDGEEKEAKWEHILNLYENNPSYKGLKLIKNLTEQHCKQDKIPKMKVKFASQLFSQTVGKTMGYLAENGLLPKEAKDTADFILFIDNLFDSMNGSFKNSKVRSGKPLLRNVTPGSEHKEEWRKAKKVLSSMKFITKSGTSGTVPSIKNWLQTIENFEVLRDKLFYQYEIKSIWCRHLNQDPLENFFGSIRSHGIRNVSPTPAGFEVAFASLLINNLSTNYSPGSNCEDDHCDLFQCFDELFFSQEKHILNETCEIDFTDIESENIVENFAQKQRNPVIKGQIEYVTGYVLRKARKIIKKCKTCENNLYENEFDSNKYLTAREYIKNKRYLTYPKQNLKECFSAIQDLVHNIMKNKSEIKNLKSYIKTVLYIVIDTNFCKCENHKGDFIEFVFDFSTRFFIHNWCKSTNKLLTGSSVSFDESDSIHKEAYNYGLKRRKNKKTIT